MSPAALLMQETHRMARAARYALSSNISHSKRPRTSVSARHSCSSTDPSPRAAQRMDVERLRHGSRSTRCAGLELALQVFPAEVFVTQRMQQGSSARANDHDHTEANQLTGVGELGRRIAADV